MIKNKQKLPMYKQRFLKNSRKRLKKSVDYFSEKNKHVRESWIAQTFLENLGLQFLKKEVGTPPNDPPDVVFRDASFEIKEILDPGRKRHLEFKEQLEKSIMAKDPADLISCTFTHELTPQDIIQLIGRELERLKKKYPLADRATMDLLFYINLIHHILKIDKMPEPHCLAEFGWRSVSALFGWASIVYYTSDAAPGFLQEKRGQLILKKA